MQQGHYTPRYVPADARIYKDSLCLACGISYGVTPGAAPWHRVVICRACNSEQCEGKAECRICLYGLTQGEYQKEDRFPKCGYAGCKERAVAKAPRVGHVCLVCLSKVKVRAFGRTVTLAEFIAEQLLERDKAYVKLDAPIARPGLPGYVTPRDAQKQGTQYPTVHTHPQWSSVLLVALSDPRDGDGGACRWCDQRALYRVSRTSLVSEQTFTDKCCEAHAERWRGLKLATPQKER